MWKKIYLKFGKGKLMITWLWYHAKTFPSNPACNLFFRILLCQAVSLEFSLTSSWHFPISNICHMLFPQGLPLSLVFSLVLGREMPHLPHSCTIHNLQPIGNQQQTNSVPGTGLEEFWMAFCTLYRGASSLLWSHLCLL